MKGNVKAARRLRSAQTDAERILCFQLRDRRLRGFKFRRQAPIDRYIVDFCCVDERLIIELDGSQHLEQEEYDKERTKYLESLGYKVVRF